MAQAAAPKLPAKKPVQTMTERVASRMPAHASLAVPGEKSHQQLLGEARKAEKKPDFDKPNPPAKYQHSYNECEEAGVCPQHKSKPTKKPMTKMEYGLALSELGACALCKKAEHAGPCM
jgi:hypothetical protein